MEYFTLITNINNEMFSLLSTQVFGVFSKIYRKRLLYISHDILRLCPHGAIWLLLQIFSRNIILGNIHWALSIKITSVWNRNKIWDI
jgi:hypothetical protein